MEFFNSRTSEEDVKGKAPADVKGNGPAEIQTTDSSGDVASSSESFPTPVLHNTPCYWVYARFFDRGNFVTQSSFYALNIKDNYYVPLPSHPFDTIFDMNIICGCSFKHHSFPTLV